MPTIIDLDDIEGWTADLLECLEANYSIFHGWETGQNRPRGQVYDRAICELDSALQHYAVVGWHCTRLTEEEIFDIRTQGLSLPDENMLLRRIDRVVSQGRLAADIANGLKAENQAHEATRAGRLWFCLFPPILGGESGINRFFRYWGGEALYGSHERNPVNVEALSSIGIPCVIEALVPISSLGGNPGLAMKIVRRYLIHRGYQTSEPCDHEDRTIQPLPAVLVRDVHLFPSSKFVELTGCRGWQKPL